MAWQKTGYQDALEYDPDRHVVKFGEYEFHGKDVGLVKDSFTFNPAGINSLNDVYMAMGADKNAMDSYGTMSALYGKQAQVFTGDDAWKNDFAKYVYDSMRKPNIASLLGESRAQSGNNITSQAAAYQFQKDYNLETQKMPDGSMTFNVTQNVPDSYAFIDRVSAMANALSASGQQSDQRGIRRRTATGAF